MIFCTLYSSIWCYYETRKFKHPISLLCLLFSIKNTGWLIDHQSHRFPDGAASDSHSKQRPDWYWKYVVRRNRVTFDSSLRLLYIEILIWCYNKMLVIAALEHLNNLSFFNILITSKWEIRRIGNYISICVTLIIYLSPKTRKPDQRI